MRPARRNPIGFPVDPSAQVVRVGSGVHTHFLNPATGMILCQSGKNAGKGDPSSRGPQQIYRANAHFVTCYRCQKLTQMNLDGYRR